ncbi:MAG TPA: DUF1330 domain-containing protein [Stellaceae bacterium]|nr:DUF1330 domain-containing protein [Stellaceae bacterium]
MAAYLIADLDVKNPAGLENYRAKVGDTLAKYGGKFIVRAGAHEVLETGQWQPKRIVVLEFPSMDALKRWYNSPDYRPLIAERKAAAAGPVVAVEGL